MNIERTMPILGLIACFAMASCSGDEKTPTPTSKEIRSGAASTTPPPSITDASAATRQPASQVPASTAQALTLDPPPAAAPDPSPMDPGSAVAGVADAEAPLLSPEDAAIPTQEEADLEANQSINDDNADEELEKLEKELGAEGGG
jgi:hypothetical protein